MKILLHFPEEGALAEDIEREQHETKRAKDSPDHKRLPFFNLMTGTERERIATCDRIIIIRGFRR